MKTNLLLEILLSPEIQDAIYLDPGSGSFILQLIIASGLGAIYMLRGYIGKFFGLFRRSGSQSEDEKKSGADEK